MTEATDNDLRVVVLKNIRIMFADSIDEAKATADDGVPKHSCVPLLESDTPEFDENKAKVIAALRAAGEEGWENPEMYKRILENKPDRVSFKKGEKCVNQETGEIYQGFEGNYAITPCNGPGGSKRPKRPLIMSRAKKWIWNPKKGFELRGQIADLVYSGVRADVKIEFYPVKEKKQGGNGIFAAIHLIRSREEGERIGGGRDFSGDSGDDFEELEDGGFGDDDDAPSKAGSSSSDDDFD
ncbi:DUF2815 family protein [Novosphingobium sp. YJ-S2-02]|uniref:DUF2815 family protein n=1 Tax=Novosphingobium aureum TaxID=2792964 RepID=A0A931MKR8_9SPHN|nr:ssDNA-binding protein [Novosphingobium aureum]MBH0113212.1 DUF2815 family protein [Novosphingobium aureum]